MFTEVCSHFPSEITHFQHKFTYFTLDWTDLGTNKLLKPFLPQHIYATARADYFVQSFVHLSLMLSEIPLEESPLQKKEISHGLVENELT